MCSNAIRVFTAQMKCFCNIPALAQLKTALIKKEQMNWSSLNKSENNKTEMNKSETFWVRTEQARKYRLGFYEKRL
jgi:hypothetical protein